jgi:hypothetical protein
VWHSKIDVEIYTNKKVLHTFTNELSPTATATALVVATTYA